MTTHITRRLNSVAGKSFSPLGVGAGERRPSCSHYPKPRGMSFNPLGGGAGAWDDPTIRQLRRREESFQSPRRWGGVGLETASPGPTTSVIALRAYLRQRLMLISYANSHAQHMQKAIERFLFQSPRRWGGVGLFMSRPLMTPRSIALFRFNPHGGGAGSGSHQRLVSIFGGIRKVISFQSPRRWGGVGLNHIPTQEQHCRDKFQSPRRWDGVGLVHLASLAQRLRLLSFNPLGGGAGSGSEDLWHDNTDAATRFRFNPLGGGAGSGSEDLWHDNADAATRFRFNPLGGGAGSGSEVAATTGPT